MTLAKAVLSGAAGAVSLTAIHQTVRGLSADAPRMDVLGMRALGRLFEASEVPPPPRHELYSLTLAGDLAANTLYYSLIGTAGAGDEVERGVLLGGAAGLGAVVLPPLLGLGSAPSGRTAVTAALTVALYTAGGIAAAVVARRLRSA